MKLKKVLSGFMAAVMAVTSSVVMTVSSSAADDELVLFSGSLMLEPWADGTDNTYFQHYQPATSSFTDGDLSSYENLTFTLTFDESDVTAFEGWQAEQSFVLAFQANAAYSDSWPTFTIGTYGFNGYDGALADAVAAGGPVEVDVPTSDIISVLDTNSFNVAEHFNAFNISAGWLNTIVTKIALTDPTDTTVYAQQDITDYLDEYNVFGGTFDTSAASGPNARIEFTFTTSSAWSGFKIVDKADADEANAADDPEAAWEEIVPIATLQDGGIAGKYTKSLKFSEYSIPSEIQLSAWGCTINSVVIYNEDGADKIFTPAAAAPTTYTIECPAMSNGGTIAFKDSKGNEITEAAEGDTVTVVLTPETGYTATGITVEGASGTVAAERTTAANTWTFEMPAEDVTVTPAFTADSYVIAVYTAEGGTAAVTGGVDKNGYTTAGTKITVTLTPDEGYRATGIDASRWVSGIVITATAGANNTWTFEMPAENVEIIPVFEAIPYTITLNPVDGFTFELDKTTAAVGEEVIISITAKPEDGVISEFEFRNDEGGIVLPTSADWSNQDATEYLFVMPAGNVTITPVLLYGIKTETPANGKVTFAFDSAVLDDNYCGTIGAGAEVTITAVPDEDYELVSLLVNSVSFTSGDTLTITESIEVEAYFRKTADALLEDAAAAVKKQLAAEWVYSTTDSDLLNEIVAIVSTIDNMIGCAPDALVKTNSTETTTGSITGTVTLMFNGATKDIEISVTLKVKPENPAVEAKELIEAYLAKFTATNDTDIDELYAEMKKRAESVTGVTISENLLTKEEADYTEDGLISGMFTLKADGFDGVQLDVKLTIAQLEKTDEMLVEEIINVLSTTGLTEKTLAEDIENVIDELGINAKYSIGEGKVTKEPTYTAVGEITYDITITVGKASDVYTAVFAVPVLVAEESVALDNTEATLGVGETVTLTATVLPENAADKTVTWTSSDDKVATVKDGVVTAVAAGEATITAKTVNGLTATFNVTVVDDSSAPGGDKPTESTPIWEGEQKFASWSDNVQIPAEKFADVKEGDMIIITYDVDDTAAPQIKIAGLDDWTVLTSPEGVDPQWGVISATTGIVTFTVNAADLERLQAAGMALSGQTITVTGVTSTSTTGGAGDSDSTPATGYTDSVNTTIPVDKMITQKTAVVDGVYSQRFVEKVSAASLESASKITFTVSNGDKTVEYSTTKVYSALTVNGEKAEAGDGYVFIVLTIKNIPSVKTLEVIGVSID